MTPSRTPIVTTLALLCLAAAPCGGEGGEGSAAAVSGPETASWASVLERYQRQGGVDYAGLSADRDALDAYLASLAQVRPQTLSVPAQIAFWSNAYNAVVLHRVLERYPEIESVQRVEGFFDRLTFPVGGQELTLDEIETRGRDLGDPRIHFAVVCASTSCPDLRGEPYRAENLDAQLADQTRRFLADPSKGMRYDAGANTLWLSSIFKWYAGDFTGGSTVVAFFARGGVAAWVRGQLPAAQASELAGRSPKIRYLDYDWSLNDRPAG